MSVSIVMAAAAWSSAAAAGPLDQPAFTAKPAALLAAGRAAPTHDASVVVLRQDTTFTFDARGRSTHDYRIVFLVEQPAGVDDWGSIELSWRPFYQDKPTIRARVIAPDGKVAALDPSLIHDAPSVSSSPQVFSDRRTMQAPLPRLAVGAVVEEELTIKDREPLLAAGETGLAFVTRDVPIEGAVLTIAAPTRLGLHVVPRGFARAPRARRTTGRGRTTWRYDFHRLPADGPRDTGVPGDAYPDPYVGTATGASWAAVAAGYRKLVDSRLAHGVAVPDGVRAATPRATVDGALAWLHAHVRYTGIELGDSAIVPWSPADTVKRGFGDCKDMAAVLVALLRGAGIDADLALLSTGPGTDVDPALPGLGPFDHAIVRARIGGKDVWIDATEPDLPAGQLPWRDQGRRALIVGPGTRGLVTTPAAPPADNLVREARTYHLAEIDNASVTEVTHEHGAFRDNLRTWYRDTSHADATKGLTSYVEGEYEGTLTGFSGTPLPDVTAPFELTVEAGHVRRAHTHRENVEVWLHRSNTFQFVPGLFKDTGADTAAAVARRTRDYVFFRPHVYEIENRLILPPGFTAPPLVAHQEEPLGTMMLTTTRRVDGGAIVITYRLDTGKRRITADELRAGRAAVRKLLDGQAERLIIPQTGAVLMDQGKLKEAMAEYQRLIALHPEEALHYEQLAEAYRRAGMGPAARRTARKATVVQPTKGDAYSILAYNLRCDSTGVEYGWDADRKAALAAYHKALELSPKHLGALADLASLLAVDEHGRPSADRRDLTEAVGALRRAKDIVGDDTYDFRLAATLFAAGDEADAQELAHGLPRTAENEGLEIAAAAVAQGPAAAIALAGALAPGGTRKQVLRKAVGHLMLAGHYDAMRALDAEAGTSAADPVHAEMVASLGRLDIGALAPSDPTRPVHLAVAAFMSVPVPRPPWDRDVAGDIEAITRSMAGTSWTVSWKKLPARLTADVAASSSKLTLDGDAATGWRVTSVVHGSTTYLYVVLDHGRARLIGGPELPAGVGRQVLALLDRRDLTGATRWLQRLADDQARSPVDNATGHAVAFAAQVFRAEVAAAGAHPPPRRALEVIAAFLVSSRTPKLALRHLHRCARVPTGTQELCRAAETVAANKLHRWAELAEAARHLAEIASTPEKIAFAEGMRARTLAVEGHATAGARIVDGQLARTPDEVSLVWARATIAIAGGSWRDAQPWIASVVGNPDVTHQMLNTLAWARLYHDPDPARARALARRAEQMSGPSPSSALLNTLAAVEAEADQPYEAWGYLARAIAMHQGLTPDDSDWYVLGRIAQDYGLRDDAIAAYRKVHKPAVHALMPSSYDFARRHLKELGAR
jgi:tetratricopeptide (TPR) repeat protein